MWPKFYRDYGVDQPLIKSSIEPGRGIVGCQMNEINGWGDTLKFRAPTPSEAIFNEQEKDLENGK